jgi:hypothetical protein
MSDSDSFIDDLQRELKKCDKLNPIPRRDRYVDDSSSSEELEVEETVVIQDDTDDTESLALDVDLDNETILSISDNCTLATEAEFIGVGNEKISSRIELMTG